MIVTNDNKMPQVAIIAALDEQNGIGRKGGLLCHLPADLKHFKEVTSGHTVIMGRKTYESLPKGALPNRTNMVLTSDKDSGNYPGCIVVRSLEEALSRSQEEERVFIIGGGEVYRASLDLTDKLFITQIHHTFDDADTFFPKIDADMWEAVEERKHEKDDKHRFNFSFITYVKKDNR